MDARTEVTFEDEQIIQEHDQQGLSCPVCGHSRKVRYSLENESGAACCPGCFLGWMVTNDATVTITPDES